jgi:hypothetical protein
LPPASGIIDLGIITRWLSWILSKYEKGWYLIFNILVVSTHLDVLEDPQSFSRLFLYGGSQRTKYFNFKNLPFSHSQQKINKKFCAIWVSLLLNDVTQLDL